MKGEILNQLEWQISVSKQAIELNDALQRLRNNPDFIKVVQKSYFEERAIKLVAYSGNPECVGEVKTSTDLDIIAIGRFAHHLNNIARAADSATNTITDCRIQIAELDKFDDEVNE
jgi:hypothetical protein